MTHDHVAHLPHHVYKYFAANNAVLYIGCTYDLVKRHKTHSKQAEWFAEANRRSHETFPDRWHGLVAEKSAIIVNRPIYNKTHNYWQPIDPRLTRELHRIASERPDNAPELLADIERQVYELEREAQRARDEELRTRWDGVNEAVFERLVANGLSRQSALYHAKTGLYDHILNDEEVAS